MVWPGVSYFARFGASALFGGGAYWDRSEIFLGWHLGGCWCWSDPSARKNNKQCVE